MAKRTRLTDQRVRSLVTDAKQETFYDESPTGFGVRVSGNTGRKTFVVRYRSPDGRHRRRISIGTYPTMKLAAARARARRILADVSDGFDPADERRRRKEAIAFSDLADLYLERYAKRQKKSWREDARQIERDLRPAWGDLQAADITRRDVIALLDEIVERGAPVMANRTLALISRMFNFAIDRELLATSPALRVPMPGKEQSRQRVLSDTEIRDFWGMLDGVAPLIAATFRLRLLTAQREIEVLNMRWENIEDDWWTIPPEVSKVGIAHRVPLSPQAMEIIETIRPLSEGRPWVFPSDKVDGHLRSSAYGVIRRLRREHGFDWVPHDLRRTAATNMARMGVQRLVIKKVLGHTEGQDITAVYDRASYDQEKREALEAWGNRVAEIVGTI